MKTRAIKPQYNLLVAGESADELLSSDNIKVVIQRNNARDYNDVLQDASYGGPFNALTNTHVFNVSSATLNLGYKNSIDNNSLVNATVKIDNTTFINTTHNLNGSTDAENRFSISSTGEFKFRVNKTTYPDTAAFEAYLQANDVLFEFELADAFKYQETVYAEPVYGAGDNDFVIDKEAVATLLKTRLTTFKGEVKRDVDFGLPDFKGLDKEDLDVEIGDIIITTTGVEEIILFESNLIDRKYSATIIVKSDYGELEVTI